MVSTQMPAKSFYACSHFHFPIYFSCREEEEKRRRRTEKDSLPLYRRKERKTGEDEVEKGEKDVKERRAEKKKRGGKAEEGKRWGGKRN